MRLSRMGGRAVECTGLENRRLFTEFVSSNLTPSAINKNSPFGEFLFMLGGSGRRTHEVSSATERSVAVRRSRQGRGTVRSEQSHPIRPYAATKRLKGASPSGDPVRDKLSNFMRTCCFSGSRQEATFRLEPDVRTNRPDLFLYACRYRKDMPSRLLC